MHDLVHITDTRIILGKLAAGKKHPNRLRNWKRIIIFFSFIVFENYLLKKGYLNFSAKTQQLKSMQFFAIFDANIQMRHIW